MTVVRVWDLPTRAFHWALAAAVPAMVVTGELGGNWLEWHFRLGYAVLTLLLFRLGWGFLGGHWSRFSTFLRGPRTVYAYFRQQAPASIAVGHNPLGGYSVMAMLLVLLLQAISGLMSDDDILHAGPLAHSVSEGVVRAMRTLHAGAGKRVLILLVLLHVAAIVWYRLRQKQNLLGPMVHGDKELERGAPDSRDDSQARGLALVLLLGCAALVAALLAWAR